MASRLDEGKSRMIHGGRNRTYKVVAECYDNDTPYIHIYKGDDLVYTLTDGEASTLAEDIWDALRILPSSK